MTVDCPKSENCRAHRTRGFTLVELVMVVTILGIVAAIAVPRMSHAVRSASAGALEATIANVRRAVDAYYAEHGKYPGYDPDTGTPDGEDFVKQLTQFSDVKGRTQKTFGHPYIYGPYLRSPFPRNPINRLSTVHVKTAPSDADPAAGAVGWVAVLSHGYFGIHATSSDLDDAGIKDSDRVRIETQ